MSEYEIPFHIQEEIMRRLPVKSLIRLRSMSKTLKSLIDSPEFISAHTFLQCHTQPHQLIVSYEDPEEEQNYVCYIDDDTFPQQRFILTLPQSVKQIWDPIVAGSSRGLVCLYNLESVEHNIILIWNPSIRKYIYVAMPNVEYEGVGFGVCPVTNDPKIVLISESVSDVPNTSCKYDLMVYTLSSGKWKCPSTNFPLKGLQVNWQTVVTNRFIYWRSWFETRKVITSFDVTNESFEVIELPHSLALDYNRDVSMYKLRESVAVVKDDESNVTIVWMMEHGVQISFTKLFTIHRPEEDLVGLRNNGIPMVRVIDTNCAREKLVVYEPNLEHKNFLESSGSANTFKVISYMETLLLLGRSDCDSY